MKKVSSILLAVLVCLSAILPVLPQQTAPMAPVVEAATYETAWWPAPTMRITQIAYESYSHGSQNALDYAPGGRVFAPFTGKITYKDANWGYVVFQSSDKVYFANGTLDYMTVTFMHDSNISDLYVGQVISQGTNFYDQGGMGNGNANAYAYHVHMGVYKGHVAANSGYGTGNIYAYQALAINTAKTTSIVNQGVMASGNYTTNSAPTNYTGLWKNVSQVQSGPPTSAAVSTANKDSFAVNENVTFNMTSNGESNTLWIYYPDGSSKYYQNAGTSKTLTFSTAGKYQALVEAWNGEGSKCSSKITFYVGNPTTATVKTNKSSYTTGENVTFTMSSDGASNTLWIYSPDGKSTYYQNAGTSKTLTFSTAGTYQALVEAWNGVGSKCSAKISFTVTKGSTTTTTTTTTTSGKPTSATIKSDKSSYLTGENVVLTFSGNGDSNTLWIYKPDGTSTYYQNAGTTKTLTFTTPGTYGALVETWNGVGSFCSTKITFTVTAPSKPTSATIKSDKSTYTVGDNVVLTFSGNGDSNTLWIYYPDGTSKYFEKAGTTKTMTFTTPGTYGALVETWNGVGSFCSAKITFTVNAKATTASTTKATTASTTKATTASTTKATTASTTKATTASTTKATTQPTTASTQPTTQPTTASTKPTTQPTTVSTTKATTTKAPTYSTINPTVSTYIHNCEDSGHSYLNGWCIYCKEQSPDHVTEPSTDPVTSATTTLSTEAPTVSTQPTTQPGVDNINDSGSGIPWLIIILVILFLGGSAGLLIFFLKKKK